MGRAVSPDFLARVSFNELHVLYPWGNILVWNQDLASGLRCFLAAPPFLRIPSLPGLATVPSALWNSGKIEEPAGAQEPLQGLAWYWLWMLLGHLGE